MRSSPRSSRPAGRAPASGPAGARARQRGRAPPPRAAGGGGEEGGAARARRSQAEVARCLDLVESAARSGENVVPACVEAVKAYATVGEIIARLRTVLGEWRPARALQAS